MPSDAYRTELEMTETDQAPEALTLQEVADGLGVHYMTAYRYVRQGQLPAYKRGSQWLVDRSDFEGFAARRTTKREARPAVRDAPWADRLEDRLLNGDAAGAWDVAVSAMNSGKTPADFHIEVLVPALGSIGELWASGKITVGDEHRASAVAIRLIGRLTPRFSQRGRRRGTVVLATPPGDMHSLPVAILADIARYERLEVVDLGCDVPLESLAAALSNQDRLRAVALGATNRDNETNIEGAIEAAKAALSDQGVRGVPVIVGGGAIEGADHASRLGADAYASDAREAVDLMVSGGTTADE